MAPKRRTAPERKTGLETGSGNWKSIYTTGWCVCVPNLRDASQDPQTSDDEYTDDDDDDDNTDENVSSVDGPERLDDLSEEIDEDLHRYYLDLDYRPGKGVRELVVEMPTIWEGEVWEDEDDTWEDEINKETVQGNVSNWFVALVFGGIFLSCIVPMAYNYFCPAPVEDASWWMSLTSVIFPQPVVDNSWWETIKRVIYLQPVVDNSWWGTIKRGFTWLW
ncbi:hypothetical protein LOTGIDRAFT_175488 [Lottia gigantea]|uniref:Uncharacterized protein n=1 Tax=Lottia gigantea TaxID=225164 RepID=V4ALB0_LOTGI|nr:hypothetical protein LOTGIDRAFT_175488 [Lottia gigantea]ESO94361.1 hypothetical protein LOTGIDRAFT_175488 [Lottia gigantea]